MRSTRKIITGLQLLLMPVGTGLLVNHIKTTNNNRAKWLNSLTSEQRRKIKINCPDSYVKNTGGMWYAIQQSSFRPQDAQRSLLEKKLIEEESHHIHVKCNH